MTSPELLAQVRRILDDVVVPYLLTDDEIYAALSDAQDTFARQTYCLYSVASLTMSAVANDPVVAAPERVFELRAMISDAGTVVRPVVQHEMEYGSYPLTANTLDTTNQNWRAATGDPLYAVTDLVPGSVRLVPIPTTDTEYTIEGYVTPSPINATQNPTIPLAYHQDLLAGAASILYASQNVELVDKQESSEWFAKWQLALDKARHQLGTGNKVTEREYVLPRTVTRKKRYAPVSSQSSS